MSSTAGLKGCPPQPGSTASTSTRSTSPASSSGATSSMGVLGATHTPTWFGLGSGFGLGIGIGMGIGLEKG